jgi:hypothetical protein
MTTTLNVRILGLDGVERALGIMASALDANDRQKVCEAVMHPTPGPGGLQRIVREGFTLEEQALDAFQSQGTNALQGRWTAYASEPKYAAYKEQKGGGGRVGIWSGSRRPLFLTFKKGHPENIARSSANGFEWGSRRYYAGRFHKGGFQPWDRVIAAGRPVVVVNDTFSREVARGHQRYVVYALRERGQGIQNLRVNL